MRHRRLLAFSFVLVALAIPARAQDPEPADERPWSASAEFSAVVVTGNSESTTISLANTFEYAWERAELIVDASALRTETTNLVFVNVDGDLTVNDVEDVTAENYQVTTKYRRELSERFLWYGSLGWDRNELSGIADRYSAGAGVGWRLIETERQKLTGEVGATYVDETRVPGTDPREQTFANARAFMGYERKIGDDSKLTGELEVLENLDDTDDLRANAVASLTSTLTELLSLKVSYKVRFDNQPVVLVIPDQDPEPPNVTRQYEFDEVDTIFSAALVVNF